MENDPPLPSCRSSTSRRTPERSLLPPSSPTMHSSSKPVKLPSVTPRRFNRFFAPRPTPSTPQTSRSARMPLADISASGMNRQVASSPVKQSRKLLDQEDEGYNLSSPSNRASPLKRVCLKHPNERPSTIPSFMSQDIPSSPPPPPEPETVVKVMPRPVKRSTLRSGYGSTTRRELGITAHSSKHTTFTTHNTKWQAETSHFYSRDKDVHVTWSLDPAKRQNKAIPFAVAPCHTNPVVAVSDEEGYVRLLDSEKNSTTHTFSRAILSLSCHSNAILDIEFSEDDSRLVTAAGDRTALVIDVKAQKSLYTMFAHNGSLRQARFQPGSGGNVIATAGRDGLIAIWDLRCSPTLDSWPPVIEGQQHAPGSQRRKFAQWVHSFMPPVLIPKDPKRRPASINSVEKSVTAMSFVTAEQPHMLLSGSATSSGICLWDMRKMRTRHLSCQNALVNTAWPNSENKSTRGIVSMAMSGDKTRLYALAKDSTLYAYSTAEMFSKGSPVDALYGFRNPHLQTNSFYCGLAVRPSKIDQTEVIAVAGGSSGPVVIPASESYLSQFGGVIQPKVDKQGVRLYNHGSVLKHGHKSDICSLGFTSEGSLVSVGDDDKARVWYEDEAMAANLREMAKDRSNDMRGVGYSEPSLKQDMGYLSDTEEY